MGDPTSETDLADRENKRSEGSSQRQFYKSDPCIQRKISDLSPSFPNSGKYGIFSKVKCSRFSIALRSRRLGGQGPWGLQRREICDTLFC